MKKIISLLLMSGISATGLSGQGLVAGWDFANLGPGGIGTSVDGFAAQFTRNNNGINTSGSLSTSLIQGSQITFASNGGAASGIQFSDGFSTTTSALFGASATGQQSLNILSAPGASFNAFSVNFTPSYDVVVHLDWLTPTLFADFLNVSYSSDGGSSWTAYAKPGSTAPGGYGAAPNSAGWQASTAGAFAYGSFGQTDGVIDLSTQTPDEFSAINAIRFEIENATAGQRYGFDNIHVAGTAVPEPSAFAAIVGFIALGFVAVRRRGK